MRIAKWGNSLAVRLPVSIVEELHLQEGDEVELVKGEYDTFIVAAALIAGCTKLYTEDLQHNMKPLKHLRIVTPFTA
jgi:antitoxin component of MazEF toxin-antitoxin module